MRLLLSVALLLFCTGTAWALVSEHSPPYPETGPGHAKLAVLIAGANEFTLHSAFDNCYYDATKPWVRTEFEMALMTFLSLRAFIPQFQTEPRSDSHLLRRRLGHSPAMQTALYHLLEEFGPQLQQFGIKSQEINGIQQELITLGAKKKQLYTSIPLNDAAYDDVRYLRGIGLVPLHSGERDFAVKQVMSRYECAIVVARILQADTAKITAGHSLPSHKTIEWSLPLNGLRVKSTPKLNFALSRLLTRFTPELIELGFTAERLTTIQRTLHNGSGTAPNAGTHPAYDDIPPSHWAFNAVEKLHSKGILVINVPR